MKTDDDLMVIDEKIRQLKKTALELNGLAENFPALFRNSSRIISSIKMLEINVTDLVDAGKDGGS